MAGKLEAGGGDGEYTQDGTTDLHGNPILRSERGGWRACSFVVGTQSKHVWIDLITSLVISHCI
jgi:hypothetical protein